MANYTLSSKWAFFEGKIIPIEEANVNIRSCILQYGTGVFDGIRAYWNDERKKHYIFRPIAHYKRFIKNSKLLLIDVKQTPEELTNISVDLLTREKYRETAYLRPLSYYSSIDLREKIKQQYL